MWHKAMDKGNAKGKGISFALGVMCYLAA